MISYIADHPCGVDAKALIINGAVVKLKLL